MNWKTSLEEMLVALVVDVRVAQKLELKGQVNKQIENGLEELLLEAQRLHVVVIVRVAQKR